MAIYHLHIDSYRRSRGRTAIGGAAYRRGLKAACRSSGKRYDFRGKGEVAFSEFIPAIGDETDYSQLANLIQLYQSVEDIETHCRATVGREIEVALPTELTLSQQVELVRSFVAEVRQLVGADRAFFDYSIHTKEGNPHTHICMSEREQSAPFTFSKTKRRDWDGEDFVRACREVWERHTNFALQQAGINQRVSAASHADRGLEILPTLHQGKAAYFESEVKAMNNTICSINQEIITKQQTQSVEKQARSKRLDKLLRRNRNKAEQASVPIPASEIPQEITPAIPTTPPAFQPDEYCGMECIDLPNKKPYIVLLLEHQYGHSFTFSKSLAYVNLNDPTKAVLNFKDKSQLLDYGDRLESFNSTPEASAERMLELAAAKGWKSVVFTGSEAFLRSAFTLSLAQGFTVYAKDEAQQKILDEIRKVRSSSASIQLTPKNFVPLSPKKLGEKLNRLSILKADTEKFEPATKRRLKG